MRGFHFHASVSAASSSLAQTGTTVPSPPSALIHSEHTCKECFSRPSIWYLVLQSTHAASSICYRAPSLGYSSSLPRYPVFCPTSLTYFSEQHQETDRLMVPVCITYPWSFKLLHFYVWKVTQKVAPYKLPQ